jgi:SAM-dependent methyltransferase
MISACRQKYHGVRYSVCDARDMSSLDKGKFGFVFFSFNGIDCVNHEERQSIIHQIQKLLRPGGYFLFSSHNLKSPPQKPWEKGLYLWSKKPGVLFQSIGEYIRNCFNYSKNVRAQFYGDGYAILIDLDENFKVLYYYTDPLSEVRRLKNHGFEEIITYTRWGLEQDPDSSKLARTPHVNFLARKPAL